MKENGIYVLNPGYDVKNDKKRIVLCNRSTTPIPQEGVSEFLGFIHPVYGIIFSLFDGSRKLRDVVGDMSRLLKLEKGDVKKIISPLIENKDELNTFYDNHCFSFPQNVLIEKRENTKVQKYKTEDFLIPRNKLDLTSWRFYSPLDILFMVNAKCSTDCIYCYAQREQNTTAPLTLERIKMIVRDASAMNLRSIDITGGEFFLYPHWEALLRELISNGFDPFISTKVPLSRETIKKIKDTGLKRIQVSLDSIIKEELTGILNVGDDYYNRLLETIRELDNSNLEIFFNTQVCSINTDNIEKLFNYLLSLRSIKKMNVGTAGFSLYKSEADYLRYRASLDEVRRIEKIVDRLKSEFAGKININFSGYFDITKYCNDDLDTKKKNFAERTRCSANFYAFILLPDGKVTICEELYRHPRFIIGDLTKQSIEEVWNSDRALELYRLSKDIIKKESACKSCDEFDECHQTRGVCWKEVLYAYGYDNWDYPDPKCPKAPKPFRTFYLE